MLRRLLKGVDDRGGVDAEVAVVGAANRRNARLVGAQGSVEWAEVGAEYLGAAQDVVKILADHFFATAPLAESAIAPQDEILVVQQHDAVGHALQDAIVANQLAKVRHFREMVGVAIDGGKFLPGHSGQRLDGREDLHDLDFASQATTEVDQRIVTTAQVEDLRQR